ncbi:MAG: 50S ribosomal protein L16 [Candidatus Omnitrophica bacterium]|nr:50S ribosomal protein L16 [Candidatus Omnitrophota bacterium]
MALMPKRVKFRKQQRGRRKGMSLAASTLTYGEYGLKAIETAWVSDKQIEAARVAIQRKTGRAGKLWIRIFPDKPITKIAAETRMGKGKGSPVGWVAVVKKGRILFEMEGVPYDMARNAMRLSSHKLPMKTKFISRGGAA